MKYIFQICRPLCVCMCLCGSLTFPRVHGNKKYSPLWVQCYICGHQVKFVNCAIKFILSLLIFWYPLYSKVKVLSPNKTEILTTSFHIFVNIWYPIWWCKIFNSNHGLWIYTIFYHLKAMITFLPLDLCKIRQHCARNGNKVQNMLREVTQGT